MPVRMKGIFIFQLLCLLLLMQACAANPVKKEFTGAPEWVIKGCSGYFAQKTGHPALCGVGSATGASPEEALTVAKIKAKADISKKLSSRIESVLTDYRSTVSSSSGSIDTQHIEEVTREISAMVLPGLEMVDSWTSPNNTLYVLVVLDPTQFRESVSKAPGIKAPEKDAIINDME
jgi:hypothetical protein